MTDQRLRALERRWRELGTLEAEVGYLRARLRARHVSVDQVRLAAHLGHEASSVLFAQDFPQRKRERLAPHGDLLEAPLLDPVRGPEQLGPFLTGSRSVAAVHFAWSFPSVVCQRLVTALAQTWTIWEPGHDVRFVSLEPDECAEIQGWLSRESTERKQSLANGGNGAVLWIQAGTVLEFLPYATGKSVHSLVDTTRALFPRTQGSDAT